MRLARLTSDWIAVRELKQEHDGAVIQLEDLNRKPNTVITGIVEQVGPGKRYRNGQVVPVQLQVGQTVYYPIEAGRARLPWDLSVRIMRETDVAGVVQTVTPATCLGIDGCEHYKTGNCIVPMGPCHRETPKGLLAEMYERACEISSKLPPLPLVDNGDGTMTLFSTATCANPVEPLELSKYWPTSEEIRRMREPKMSAEEFDRLYLCHPVVEPEPEVPTC